MLFSSMIFLWVFLPIVIIGNFILSVIPFRDDYVKTFLKNGFLLLASLFFYAWGGINYLFIMLSSILINYISGRFLHSFEGKKGARRLILICSVILNLGILFFFKYFNMVVISIEAMSQNLPFGEKIHAMISMEGTGALGIEHIVLPIGISFFTFQSMSYVIDVYMGKAKFQRNLIYFALYVALFPQLIAGPIVKYSDVAAQITKRRETIVLFSQGIKRFSYGLGKKVLISNTFAQVADEIWALDVASLGTSVAWLGAIFYTLQIYYDFSGYSDMAIGLGKMFGFEFKENFNYPYLSGSVQEFWRRWHISLSTWFKEYVYIPLGGNRKGTLRTYINVFLVFLLTGIWHGANFTFIAWGLFYALLQILERLFLGKLLQKNPVKILNHVYTLLAVVVGWVYFRSDTIFQANEYIGQMFSLNAGDTSILSFLSMKVLVMFVAGVLCAGILQGLFGKLYDKIQNKLPVMAVDFGLQMFLLVYSIALIVSGTYNPFIYFQF
ncbi:MAG: MBOAT family protein [Lachnospiraceae bacterium]|nr:MBOAT family protein [Lachnospiraceae bacterium]